MVDGLMMCLPFKQPIHRLPCTLDHSLDLNDFILTANWCSSYSFVLIGCRTQLHKCQSFDRGTSGIDIDLRRVDIDQCPQKSGNTQLNIFAASDKCKFRTTKVSFMEKLLLYYIQYMNCIPNFSSCHVNCASLTSCCCPEDFYFLFHFYELFSSRLYLFNISA